MKTTKLFLQITLFFFLFSILPGNAQQNGSLKMWYNKPAKVWNEALPIGNGRLGAMVYGDPVNDKIQLNEGSFWSGGPSRNDNPDALNALAGIRQLIFDGNYSTVESLVNQKMKAKTLHGSMYQPVGFLNLNFPDHSSYTNYYRELDLERAVFTTTYKVGEVTYKREVFASQPDQVIVVRLSADQPGMLTFAASVNSPLQKTAKALDESTLELTGLSSTSEGLTGQVKFDARIKILKTGGTSAIISNKINVSNADEVVLLISIATNFVDYKTLTANDTDKCMAYLADAETRTYSELYSRHEDAFQKYFNRVKIDLGSSSFSSFPTDLRIKNFSQTQDNELVAMYYQFGRYLLISCSQPGGQPATLQGLWNDQVNPSWDSKYTININTEMNYWPAEKCNMTEMHEPLIKMVQELSETGKQTAKDMYGCDGWVTHHNTDIWRICGVVDGAYWGMWPMGGAWLSQHLWEKYLYSGDLAYLDTIYPVLESACQFYQDFLVPEPKHNWLVVSPSISPENNPSIHSTSICAGTTMDNQILFDLFSKTIKAAELLNKDTDLIAGFKNILENLAPMQIGKYGQLQEWMDDWDNPNDQHRHVSHLYGLYPSNQISPYSSPDLFDAARTSLNYRGDVSTGWSMGWKVNFWARLQDGNHARKLITDQLTLVDPVLSNAGGTYPNFFDAHPPFQIDGNFGCTSGITEMLMQSHDGAIHFLPALPDDWKTGEISGLRAYGGFDVSFSWKDGQIEKIIIKSGIGGNCRIRVPNEISLEDSVLKIASGTNPNQFYATAEIKNPLIVDSTKIGSVQLKNTFLFDLQTEAGETYTLLKIKNPGLTSASVRNTNPKLIVADFDEILKRDAQPTGFSVKIDSTIAEIDSTTFGNSDSQLLFYLKDSIYNENEVFLTYHDGNVVSRFNVQLNSFTDTLVENLLPGASPRIVELKTTQDGLILIASFNMKMIIPSDISDIWVDAEYNGTKKIGLTQCNFSNEDSSILSFTLSEQVYADYQLSLSNSGNNLVSVDSGILKTFTNKSITNNSPGLPFKIKTGKVQSDGASVFLEFEKPLKMNFDQSYYFTITKNGLPIAIKDLVIANTISIYVSDQIRFGDSIKVSYTPGSIASTDNGILEGFNDFTMANTLAEPAWIVVPGRIEAENFFSQFGIQTENTGDTGGGKNIGWIDDNDWMEYAINNTSDDTLFNFSFRLASPSGGSIISVYTNDFLTGSVSVSSTGAWQTYQSFKKDLVIKPGTQYLKLYAKKAGFNFNYVDVIRKTTGIEENRLDAFKVFPNPATGQVSIETKSKIADITIYNSLGTKVFESKLNNNKLTIDISNFKPGLYLISIKDLNSTTIFDKFIVN